MAAKKEPKLSPGQKMVSEILAEMTEANMVPDAKETALLDAAREMVDRMASLDAIVAADGLMVSTPAGPRVHPAAVEVRQIALALPRILAGIVVADTHSGGPHAVKNPKKVHAAESRWRAHNIAKANPPAVS